MEEVISMSNLPSNKFLDPIFEKEDLDEGFKVIWFLKNVFFLVLRSVVGPTLFYKILLGDWALEYTSTQFRDFAKMSSFS